MTNVQEEVAQQKRDVDPALKHDKFIMILGILTLLGVLFFVCFFAALIYAFGNEDGGPFVFTLIVSFGFAAICCFTITLLQSFQSGKVVLTIFSIVCLLIMIYFQVCLLAPALRFLRAAYVVQEYPVSNPDSED